MPLFDYVCNQCDHEFETLQNVNDEPLEICPECNQSTLKKKVAAPSFTFKGGGWYKDLYGSSGASGGSSSKGSSSETSTTSSKSSDAKKSD